MQTLISKSEIAGFKKAKGSVTLRGGVDSEESLQALITTISENIDISSLFLEDISLKISKAIPTLLKKNTAISMLILSNMSIPAFNDLISGLTTVNTLQALLLYAPLTHEQAVTLSQHMPIIKSLRVLGLMEDNVELVLNTVTSFPYIKSLSIDNLNGKNTDVILKTITKFSSLEKLMILKKIDEKDAKILLEKNVPVKGGSQQLDEILNKVKQEVSKAKQGEQENKKAQTITEKAPVETPELPNQYKSLQPIFFQNQSLEESNKQLEERIKENEQQLKLLIALTRNKRPNENESEEPSNKKMKLDTNDRLDIEKLLQPVLPNQNKTDDFKQMIEKITTQNIESILTYKFPKYSNTNVLCLVANYKPEMFIEFYKKCMSVSSSIHNFLFLPFGPNAFNVFHAICKKFTEKNLKLFIELIPENIFKNLIWSLSKKINSVSVAPIHLIALFHSNELISDVLKKIGKEDLTKHQEEGNLLYYCLKNNLNIQDYHKNYIFDQFSLKQSTTGNFKLELPTDAFLDITKSSELTMESLLSEHEKLTKEKVELTAQMKTISQKIRSQIEGLPIFYSAFCIPPQPSVQQTLSGATEALTSDPRELIYKTFK